LDLQIAVKPVIFNIKYLTKTIPSTENNIIARLHQTVVRLKVETSLNMLNDNINVV